MALLEDARAEAVQRRPRSRLTPEKAARRRRAKACSQVRLGGVSRARQELLVVELAPGIQKTLDEVTIADLRGRRCFPARSTRRCWGTTRHGLTSSTGPTRSER